MSLLQPSRQATQIFSTWNTYHKTNQQIEEILDAWWYRFHVISPSYGQPFHFLTLYEGKKLLWYLQYEYHRFPWSPPFYYIESLQNVSGDIPSRGVSGRYRKGIGKSLMQRFLQYHDRFFLDDIATIHGNRVPWYYAQFGMEKLEGTHIWFRWFSPDEAGTHIPCLLTRVVQLRMENMEYSLCENSRGMPLLISEER